MYPLIKRTFDFALAFLLLLIFSPILLLIAASIRLTCGRGVLFRQVRPGFNERLFTCLKFRTMTNQPDAMGNLLRDELRLLPLGRWLRKTSLDELPQLWNILRGDLSFVGPRPLLLEYLPFYTDQERRRHSVRPGLTGLAQIHGRNHTPFDERLALDVWYVDHISFGLDLHILWATVKLVLIREGTELVEFPPLHVQRQSSSDSRR